MGFEMKMNRVLTTFLTFAILAVVFSSQTNAQGPGQPWQILQPVNGHKFVSSSPITTLYGLAIKPAGTPGTIIVRYPDIEPIDPGDPSARIEVTQQGHGFALNATNCNFEIQKLDGKDKLSEGDYHVIWYECTTAEYLAMTDVGRNLFARDAVTFEIEYSESGGDGDDEGNIQLGP
jgi:hypothetical protein